MRYGQPRVDWSPDRTLAGSVVRFYGAGAGAVLVGADPVAAGVTDGGSVQGRRGLLLSGTGSVELPNFADGDHTCIWMWFCLPPGGSAVFVRGRDGSGSGWSWSLSATESTVSANVVTTGGGVVARSADATGLVLKPWRWYFAAQVASHTNGIRGYLDGRLVASTSFSATTWRSSTAGLRVGGGSGSGSAYGGNALYHSAGWATLASASSNQTPNDRQIAAIYEDTKPQLERKLWRFGGSGSSAVSVVLGALSGIGTSIAPVVSVGIPVTLGASAASAVTVTPESYSATTVAPGATVGNAVPVAPSLTVGVTVAPGATVTRAVPVALTLTVGNTLVLGATVGRGTLIAPVIIVVSSVLPNPVSGIGTLVATTLTVGSLVTTSPLSGTGVIPTQEVSNGTGLTLGVASGAGTVIVLSLTVATTFTIGPLTSRGVTITSTSIVGNTVNPGSLIGSAVAVNSNVAVGLNVSAPVVTTASIVITPIVLLGSGVSLTPVSVSVTTVSPVVLWGVTLSLQPLFVTGVSVGPDLNVDLIALLGPVATRGMIPTVTVLIISDLAAPGGVFRRAVLTWDRITGRATLTWDRVVRRSLETWTRVWRYEEMSVATEGKEIIAAEGDDRDYGFDARFAPELKAGTGITITSGAIVGGTGLTFGTVSVIDAVFDGIPIGKGVKVQISGGVAGTKYKFACVITLSNGRELVIPARLSKVPDYDGAP